MKNKQLILYYIPILLIAIVAIAVLITVSKETIEKGQTEAKHNDKWNSVIAEKVNKSNIKLVVDNVEIDMNGQKMYMTDNMELMIPRSIVVDTFNCAQYLKENKIVIQKGSSKAEIAVGTNRLNFDDNLYELSDKVNKLENEIYVPKTIFQEYFGYEYSWNSETCTAYFKNKSVNKSYLPERYSYYDEGRTPVAKDQGDLGTCWAFATFASLETSLMPEVKLDFSEDHLVYNNECGVAGEDGGYYNVSMAYLVGWKGPVLEEDDPYGDRETNALLKPVKHVQEAEIIPSKDYEQIKEKVFKYGGVESSIYMSLNDENSKSVYYNKEDSAYCYIGENQANHEIVIIGWDDNFPKKAFNNEEIKEDGAFICMNSWGTDFGEEGIFYISYADTHIGDKNICYTVIEDVNNYDNIYQSDLCGWTGTMGYEGSNNAYFANVYTGNGNEKLEAVGFYTTTENVDYEVFICEDYENKESLNERNHIAAKGNIKNTGYYTIKLDEAYKIKNNKKYAIIVKMSKKDGNNGNLIPLEIENESITEVDITDGEGYISESGHNWQSAEKQGCNICLKAYTTNN